MNKPNDTKTTIRNAQVIQPDQGRDPFFINGDERADYHTGDTIAVAISVNFNVRDGERSRGHAIVLHEVPLMRRIYPGGTLNLFTEWVPGLARTAGLNPRMFEEEVKRLVRSYTIPRENGGAHKIFAEVYGDTEAEATKRLHAGMKAIYEGWVELEKKAKKSLAKALEQTGKTLKDLPKGAIHGMLSNHITVEDLEALVALVEPKSHALDAVTFDAINTDEGKDDMDLSGDDRRASLIKQLQEGGFDSTQADEIAIMAIESSVDLPEDLLMQSSLVVNGKLDKKLAVKARKICAAWAESNKAAV